jgi:hypothetical protein
MTSTKLFYLERGKAPLRFEEVAGLAEGYGVAFRRLATRLYTVL